MAVVAALCGPGPASAETVEGRVSIATPAGEGAAAVLCAWALPDMVTTADDDGARSATGYDPLNVRFSGVNGSGAFAAHYGFQYDDGSFAAGSSDFSPSGPAFPCSEAPPGHEETGLPVIAVQANVEDLPYEQRIQVWAAVESPEGSADIDDVFTDVYHPDGTLKAQIHHTRVPTDDTPVGREEEELFAAAVAGAAGTGRPPLTCESLGTRTEIVNFQPVTVIDADAGSMWWGAYHTEQVAENSITASGAAQGLVTRCVQNGLGLYFGEFVLSKHQPCGRYLVETNVRNGSGTVVPGTGIAYEIDVQCTVALDMDFGAISFGTVTRGGWKWVTGNETMEATTLDGSAAATMAALPADTPQAVAPTLRAVGSHGLNLKIGAVPFLPNEVPPGTPVKPLERFAAMFGRFGHSSSLERIQPLWAIGTPENAADPATDTGGMYSFGSGDLQTMCANETAKLDLAIYAGSDIPSGLAYEGTILLVAVADTGTDHTLHEDDAAQPRSGFTCNNDRGVYHLASSGTNQRAANTPAP